MSYQFDAVRPAPTKSPSLVLSSSRHPVFYAAAFMAIAFELLAVWLIMPLPGSQRMRSIDVAYAVHQWRWPVRVVLGALILLGAPPAWRAAGWRRWIAPAALAVVAVVAYVTNFVMAADQMFKQPTVLTMLPASTNTVKLDRLVVGIEIAGVARAYPLMFIGYHHQVRDTMAGREILVSYCTVCRTGRVFSPLVDGKGERFRLVGMDHWNAMFEDETTKSWWRQANGEAVTGPRKGKVLAEWPSQQLTLAQWLALHPASLVMQGDPAFTKEYAKDYAYEKGTSRKTLTGTDTTSWGEKSWVIGIVADGQAVAFDWNRLKKERAINAMVGSTPIVLALATDNASFFAFARPDSATTYALRNDSLVAEDVTYALSGRGPAGALRPIPASQEFWHSWRTFQPKTLRF